MSQGLHYLKDRVSALITGYLPIRNYCWVTKGGCLRNTYVLFQGLFLAVLAVSNINCSSGGCKNSGDSPGANATGDDSGAEASNFEPDNSANVQGFETGEQDPNQLATEDSPRTGRQPAANRRGAEPAARQTQTAELTADQRQRLATTRQGQSGREVDVTANAAALADPEAATQRTRTRQTTAASAE